MNTRNSYRHRPFDTRTGTIELAVPKLRAGSFIVFGGSIAKLTDVDGLSDIDSLVRLGPSAITGGDPVDVIASFQDVPQRRLLLTEVAEIHAGRLA